MIDWYTIGEFAEAMGVSAKALRHYEKIGLLLPHTRSDKGYRYYSKTQLEIGKSILEFQQLGFSLMEVRTLLEFERDLDKPMLIDAFRNRLQFVRDELEIVKYRKRKLENILTSLQNDNEPLSGLERKEIMKYFRRIRIVVTGTAGLIDSAEKIQRRLEDCGVSVSVQSLESVEQKIDQASPSIWVVPEDQLGKQAARGLKPDIVVVRNISDPSPAQIEKYLDLYDHVGLSTATVLNADDMASIELAKHPQVQKGKIFYFSKNKGLEDQIKRIGGVISDGEVVRIYGHNCTVGAEQKDRSPIVTALGRVMPFDQEMALISSLAALLDVGMNRCQMSGVS